MLFRSSLLVSLIDLLSADKSIPALNRSFTTLRGEKDYLVAADYSTDLDNNFWLIDKKGKVLDTIQKVFISYRMGNNNTIHNMSMFRNKRLIYLLATNLLEDASLYIIASSKGRPRFVFVSTLFMGRDAINLVNKTINERSLEFVVSNLNEIRKLKIVCSSNIKY